MRDLQGIFQRRALHDVVNVWIIKHLVAQRVVMRLRRARRFVRQPLHASIKVRDWLANRLLDALRNQLGNGHRLLVQRALHHLLGRSGVRLEHPHGSARVFPADVVEKFWRSRLKTRHRFFNRRRVNAIVGQLLHDILKRLVGRR